MSDKTITLEAVNLQDSLMFLWKLRNMVSNAEYELYAMVNKRKPFPLPEGCYGSRSPLVKEDDSEQDLLDEVLAENLFFELRDAVVDFLNTYTGVTVRDANNNTSPATPTSNIL